MGYEPYRPDNRNDQWRNDDGYERSASRSYGYGYDPERESDRSSARDYVAAGYRERGGRDHDLREPYRREWGGDRYGGGDRHGYAPRSARRDEGYAPDRFSASRDPRRGQWGRESRPDGYDYDDRGFFDRAGDEVRSWFGDADAERRRAMDARYDARHGDDWSGRDADYHGWRRRQIDDLDRDYHEYRRENASRFENEFGAWRSERQGQRSALHRVSEHMEVVGADGSHVGTVDKVRGDRIILTKSDPDAGGHHHSIPSRWIESVDDNVTIRKTADEAKAAWRDEDRNSAMFGDRSDGGVGGLNRRFSESY